MTSRKDWHRTPAGKRWMRKYRREWMRRRRRDRAFREAEREGQSLAGRLARLDRLARQIRESEAAA
jgi:hypothetical protein